MSRELDKPTTLAASATDACAPTHKKRHTETETETETGTGSDPETPTETGAGTTRKRCRATLTEEAACKRRAVDSDKKSDLVAEREPASTGERDSERDIDREQLCKHKAAGNHEAEDGVSG